MDPKQALELLVAVTERLAPDLQLTMATPDGKQVIITGTSRSLHRSIGEALRVLGEMVERMEQPVAKDSVEQ